MMIPKQIFYNLFLLLVVVCFGALGYMVIEQWTFFDGLYMTVITLTTIGFGEIHQLSFWGRVFTMVLIIVGLGTITYTLSSISAIFFGQHVYHFLHKKRMQEKIKTLKNHYIVCGASEIGLAVVHELASEKIPVLLIDRDEQKITEIVDGKSCFGLVGDATQDHVLEQAQILTASGLVATFGNDHENVYLIMSARQLNPRLKIFSKVKDEETKSKLLRAGADQIINPYTIGGMRLASLILRPQVVKLMDELAKDPHQLRIEELVIDANHPLSGQKLHIEEVERHLHSRVITYKKAKQSSYRYSFEEPLLLEEGDSLFFIAAKH